MRQAKGARAQRHEDAQADGAQEVAGGRAGGGSDNDGADGAIKYQAALKAKDEKIAELEGKIADAAKTSEATDALNAEISALKRQMADERVEFALKSAGARNVKAARALLDDYEGDVSKMKEAEPWLFAQVEGTSQNTSQNFAGGATGLKPAGVARGGDSTYMRRWEHIAGLTDESKEG